jgi:hypothetical protein
MAVERGQLQELVFDNKVLFSHRALGALLGAICKLPAAKRLLAGKVLKSRYVESILRRI